VVNTDPFGYIGDPPPTGPPGPPGPPSKGAGGALLLVCAALSAGPAAMIGRVGWVVPVVLGVLGVAWITVVDAVDNARKRHAAADPAATASAPADGWADAQDRFHRVRGEYADYECDPLQVLRLPVLADPAVPSTARFVDAFADAQGLETERFPGPGHARQFVDAVDRAESAWRAARAAARRIRLAGLDPGERAAVERAIKLLTTAAGSDNEAERLLAYARARGELARLDRSGGLRLPPAARAALAGAVRGALPPA
jgi:hypothetical protein